MVARINRSVQFGLVLAIMILMGSAIRDSSTAKAGHSIGTADCYNGNPSTMCFTMWPGPANILPIHVENQYSGSPCWNPSWTNAFTYGANAWTSPGSTPTVVSFGYEWPSMGWVFLNCHFGLAPGVLGYTDRCPPSSACQVNNTVIPTNNDYAVLWFNDGSVNPGNGQQIFVHELGHALGLAHHDTNNTCNTVMRTSAGSCPWVNTPLSLDFGNLPPCSGSTANRGVRCIYHWPY